MDKGISVIDTGYYVPENVLTNDDLSKIVDTSDEWIYPRTGIKKRHICKDETLIDMAYKASLKALNNINKEDIGIIIVATMSSPYNTPSIACLLQERLGLNNNVDTSANSYLSISLIKAVDLPLNIVPVNTLIFGTK